MDHTSACALRTKKKMAVALKQLMETIAFEKITVSDITTASKIHRQTFYYHFQDRYELLDWLLYNELLLPFLTDFDLDNMYDKLEKLFATMAKDKKFYQNAFKIDGEDLTRYVSKVATEQFVNIVKKIGEQNGVEGVDSECDIIIAEFFGYGITGVVMSWAGRGMKESPAVMTSRIQTLVEACRKLSDNVE